MSFEAPREEGLCERAARIALKFYLTYDPVRKCFVGPPFSCAAAQAELDKWLAQQSRKKLIAERKARW